jgi:hypothetical protein
MSQENVEMRYRAAGAFNRHDLDVLLALCEGHQAMAYTKQTDGHRSRRTDRRHDAAPDAGFAADVKRSTSDQALAW